MRNVDLSSHPSVPKAASGTSKPQSRLQAVLRVTSGNFLEMYDFIVFGFYATSIGHTFFPSRSVFASLMLSWATFGAGFLMRPLGAVVLGAYFDRHGRRQGLMLTLALMAVGILLIATVPGYAQIGLFAPLLVLGGRLLQGFSAGVELGGVSVYLAEIAPPRHRGFYVSWQSASQQVAVVFAALLGATLSATLGTHKVDDWAWRIPFVIGCLIVPLLMLLRRSLQETEEFQARAERPDLRQTIRTLQQNWSLIASGTLLVILTTVSFYMITAYTPTYGKTVLKLGETHSLIVTLCVGVSNFLWLPLMGALSDRVGRRPTPPHMRHLVPAHRLPRLTLAHRRPQLWPSAWRRTLAVFPLRLLQQRDGRHAHRDYASRRPRLRLLARLQPCHRPLRRLHPRRLHLPDSCHRQQGHTRRLAFLRRRLRPHRRPLPPQTPPVSLRLKDSPQSRFDGRSTFPA